ncbi:hypothetical protein [Wenzhouxiangella limi]|uniref:Uncharacterized protein n=1 Tax=Wenzhouxiangella limi TaxID=2707351 RepID=A0A845UYN4_9GAMM|nr:hypothetical protein [Wenzhouxiangella limi]NDY96933.1 hypothetical protein [Wenzhouxiangella limi]
MPQARYRRTTTSHAIHAIVRRSGQMAGELLALTSLFLGLFASLLTAASFLH